MSEKFEKKLFRVSVVFLLLLAFFCYGVVVGNFEIKPYETIQGMYNAIESFLKYGRFVPENQLVKASSHHLIQSPDNASNKSFTIHIPEKMMEGFYIFQLWDDQSQTHSAMLYNHLGELLFTWQLDYLAFDPDGPLNGVDGPHGFTVLQDGSVMANYDKGDVMVRVDSCGHPIWVTKGVFHHSFQKAEDGTYWTWRGEGSSDSHYQYMVNFDPDTGDTIREIAFVEELIQNNEDSWQVFLVRPDFPFKHFDKAPSMEEDLFHPNDIDVLYSDLAPMFPDFEPGDLLISMRHINLIAVLDPDSLDIKWWQHGPWWWPHDPDFTADGKISVYNNNPIMGRSEILKVDPKTKEVVNELYSGNLRFYSKSMGKHQYLPNGNVLIVSPEEGQTLVVSATGQIILEYNNISTQEGLNAIINNALWVPSDYFDTFPNCPQ